MRPREFCHKLQDIRSKPNETTNEPEHLTEIRADKGGPTVIQHRMDNCKEVYQQLNNQERYRQLPANPTKEHTRQLNRLIKTFNPVLQSILCTVIP
eukprot:g38124.t1